jgi:hypothetical protein
MNTEQTPKGKLTPRFKVVYGAANVIEAKLNAAVKEFEKAADGQPTPYSLSIHGDASNGIVCVFTYYDIEVEGAN